MQTKMTWKVRVLSLVLICLALLALSLLTDISTIGAAGRFASNAVMAALLMSVRSFDTVLDYAPRYRDRQESCGSACFHRNIVLLVWDCMRGTVGPNRFGPDPLAATSPSQVR